MTNNEEFIAQIRTTDDEKILYLHLVRIINNLTFKKKCPVLQFWIEKLENVFFYNANPENTDELIYIFKNVKMEHYTIQEFFILLKHFNIEKDLAALQFVKAAVSVNSYY